MKKYKLKKWYWNLIKPKDWDIDFTILELSKSNSANEKITKRLEEEFLQKYYSFIP